MLKRTVMVSMSVVLVAVLCACSVPGQRLSLSPVVKAHSMGGSDNRAVSIVVRDLRTDDIIGFRDGGGSRRGPLSVEPGAVEAIKGSAVGVLIEHGFRPTEPPGDPSLTLELAALTYRVESEIATKKVSVTAIMGVKAERTKNGRFESYVNQHKVEKDRTMVVTPSEEDNVRFVNAVVSEALSLSLNDRRLLAFLNFE